MIPIMLYSILDRFLLVWWYRVEPLDSTLLSRTFLKYLKYAPVLLVIICGVSVYRSYSVYYQACVSIVESPECIQYEQNVLFSIYHMNAVVVILFIVGGAMFLGLIAIDFKLGKWMQSIMKSSTELENYLKCLSERHRKLWLAEIHHRKKRYGIDMLTEDTKTLLLKKATECKDVHINDYDLYNYDKLTQRFFKKLFGQKSTINRYLTGSDETIMEVMYGGYMSEKPQVDDDDFGPSIEEKVKPAQ